MTMQNLHVVYQKNNFINQVYVQKTYECYTEQDNKTNLWLMYIDCHARSSYMYAHDVIIDV